MARRRNSYDDDYYDDSRSRSRRRRTTPLGGRKTVNETRFERMVWFALLLVFALPQLVSESALPNYAVPGLGAVIMLGSSYIQQTRRWRVSPISWLAGAAMAFFAYTSYTNPEANVFAPTMLAFGAVILFGVITGET